MTEPRPIAELDPAGIMGLFFDIDDTFSTSGKITHEAYSSIWRLKGAEKSSSRSRGGPPGGAIKLEPVLWDKEIGPT